MKHFAIVAMILSVGLTSWTEAPAYAQEGKLSATAKTLSRTPRSGAAIPMEWKLTWRGTAILEGTLAYSIFTDDRLLGECRVEDIVLSGGEKRIRTMLPPIGIYDSSAQIVLRGKFVSKQKTFDLPNLSLRVPPAFQRLFTVAVCRSTSPVAAAANTLNADFEQSLRFESFDPKRGDRMLQTILTHVAPGDMPEGDPHAYCGFDVVVLTPESLPMLRERQLTALRQWVNAGGSLIVVPGGILEQYHVDFLNGVAKTGKNRSPFILDDAGGLTDQPAKSTTWLVRTGIGRVAVLRGPPPSKAEFDSPEWKRMVWFVWKMQREFLQPILKQGKWRTANPKMLGFEEFDPETGELNRQFGIQPNQAIPPQDYRPQQVLVEPLPSASWLLERLLPETINIVPMSVIGLILFVYLLIVGPGDYLILGKLKLRKYTWVVFPVVTLMAAGFTVWLSHRYMQADDRRRSIVFLDVGDDGAIVRSNRIDLIFNGSPGMHETEVRRGLFTAMNHRSFSAVDVRFGGSMSTDPLNEDGGMRSLVAPPIYSGHVPSRFEVMQTVPQWTPQMNRVLQIAPDEEKPGFDFASIAPGDFRSQTRLAEHGRRITLAFGDGASAYVCDGDRFDRFAGPDVRFTPAVAPDHEFRYNMRAKTVAPPSPYSMNGDPTALTGNFIREACVRPQSGLFSLVSQIAPAAGRTFEDLALLDTTDPNQWLLVIVVRRGDRVLVYRKLYVDE